MARTAGTCGHPLPRRGDTQPRRAQWILDGSTVRLKDTLHWKRSLPAGTYRKVNIRTDTGTLLACIDMVEPVEVSAIGSFDLTGLEISATQT